MSRALLLLCGLVRTFGRSSTQSCSQCLTVDQKVIYSCIPNGAAC